MKRIYLLLALLCATGLVAAGCGGDDDEQETQTLELVSIEQPGAGGNINFGGAGEGFLIADELQEDGETVGSDAGLCTFTGGTDNPSGAACHVTLDLEDRGTIEVQGLLDFESETTELAIVGGTGDFTGASGTLTADITQQRETPLTLEFTTEDGEE